MASSVRLATADDLDAVRFIGIATWPPTYAAQRGPRFVVANLDEYWNAEVMSAAIAAGSVYVAEVDDAVVGMSQMEDLGNDVVLWKLYVLPEHHGEGHGRALIDAAKAHARARGRSLLTEYDRSNAVVAGFYAAQGFVPTPPPWPSTDTVWLRWAAS